MNNSHKTFWTVIVLCLIVLIIGGFLLYSQNKPLLTQVTNNNTACTQEAKLCPDGSSVGRTGPNCEFAACPAVVVPDSWITFKDQANNVEFKYPPTLGTKYLGAVDWPPKVQILGDTPTCNEAGNATSPAGQTKVETINNRTYCVTEETEGAAGTIYHQYAYGVLANGQYAILTFSLRYPQCVNYDDPKKSECQIEEQNFDVGKLVDQIVSTLNVVPQSVL